MKYKLTKRELIKFYSEFYIADGFGLEYLDNFISLELKDEYIKALIYCEIFENGWTLKELLEMGKKDKYWSDIAESFIKVYGIEESRYNEYSTFFNEYIEIRNHLLSHFNIDISKLKSSSGGQRI